MQDSICLHCEGPLEAADERQVVLNGTVRPVCCEACETAAQTIIAKGLADFYRFRDAPAARDGSQAVAGSGNSGAAGSAQARWASYDREVLQTEFVSRHSDGTRTAHLLVQGVRCAACSWLIERGIAPMAGIESISVNALTTRADIRWDPKRIALSQILSQIALLGFTPYPHTDDAAEQASTLERHQSLKRLIVAGLGMMQVTTYAVALYAGAFQGMDPDIERFLRLISLLVATPVVLYAGAPFFVRAWRDLAVRSPGMDVPVALAIGGAYAASVWNSLVGNGEVYFDSATMFVFFLTAARHLEMTGRHRVLGLSDAYGRHMPRVATRLADGQPMEVGVMELEPGDTVLVNPGQTFPADGILKGQDIYVDEALLTGESEPLLKHHGDRVVAGAINQRIAAEFVVDRVGADTELAQIGHLMLQAQTEKPPVVQLANRVASRFVIGVLLAAFLVGCAWWIIAPEQAFSIVLAVLVVTCPCALALATPAAFTVASSTLASRGFLIRRAGALEELQRVTDMLFDKTGTLTERQIALRDTRLLAAKDCASVLAVAAALEARSEHPIAHAFRSIPGSVSAESVQAEPGAGLEGCVAGKRYRIGTAEYVSQLAGAAAPEMPVGRHVFIGDEQQVLACFELAEAQRAGAAAMIQAFQQRGLSTMIASGDRAASVAQFAAQLGVPAYRAEQKPADKLELLRELQQSGATVAMVGDGINDSPVLAGANISIAMGSGTSLAQHSADCVMLTDDLFALVDAYDMAKKTMQVVRQNIYWAVGYNLIALPLAATGVLAPWMAALGMSASSLLVTANALRLSRQQTRASPTTLTHSPVKAQSAPVLAA